MKYLIGLVAGLIIGTTGTALAATQDADRDPGVHPTRQWCDVNTDAKVKCIVDIGDPGFDVSKICMKMKLNGSWWISECLLPKEFGYGG